MNLGFTFNFTLNTTRYYFSTLLPVILDYLLKMGCMDKKHAVFEQLRDLKKWSSTALNTFNNYTIITTNNRGKIRISSVWCFCLLFIFELIQQAALVIFKLYLNIFKILKISFWRKNRISLAWKLLKYHSTNSHDYK